MKKRFDLWLESDVVDLVRLETNNLSRLVNELLTRYTSADSTEGIKDKIKEHENAIMVLKEKVKILLEEGLSNNATEEMNKNIFGEMQEIYRKRREQIGDNKFADEQWITAPKNIQKCKIIGKEPLVFLEELREWYDNRNGKQTTLGKKR